MRCRKIDRLVKAKASLGIDRDRALDRRATACS
jgi:hypothetical protein